MSGNHFSRLLLFVTLKILLSLKSARCFTPITTAVQFSVGPSSSGGVLNPRGGRVSKLRKGAGEEASGADDDGGDDEWIAAEIAEVITNDVDDDEEEAEWIPDREKARRKRKRIYAEQVRSASAVSESNQIKDKAESGQKEDAPQVTAYTDEEEELIISMGGKKKNTTTKREPGYLGDSTLREIATDYSVPVCYLADVLCMWGVPVPINVDDRLGDLVTGEQAFAIVEAVNSLDIAALQDRYSNQSLLNVCNDWNVDLSEGFEMAMKEGWSLPFGVQTVLRVEQEEELLRVLAGLSA